MPYEDDSGHGVSQAVALYFKMDTDQWHCAGQFMYGVCRFAGLEFLRTSSWLKVTAVASAMDNIVIARVCF